jgi:hypothetical protein
MRLEVPKEKDPTFGTIFFQAISEGLTDLKLENGKWPNTILFCGPLGEELFDHLTELSWDMTTFNPTKGGGLVNKIRVEYSKPISQIEERGGTVFDEALSTKTLNGIPDARTMAKIQTAYSNLAYTIERSVRPSYEIKLFRKK